MGPAAVPGWAGPLTWSDWLVSLMRNLRKLSREHLRMRIRSEEPSPRWAAGDRPRGLRGQAQDMLVALMARNLPQTTFHSSMSSADREHCKGVWTGSPAQLPGDLPLATAILAPGPLVRGRTRRQLGIQIWGWLVGPAGG